MARHGSSRRERADWKGARSVVPNLEEGVAWDEACVDYVRPALFCRVGDKTQRAVFTLVARRRQPIPIFIGAALALVLVWAIGVVVGQGVAQVVPDVFLRRGAAALFVVMGLLIWFDIR